MGERLFGTLPDGAPVRCFTIAQGNISAEILTYGAIIRDLKVGGRSVVLGFEDLADYLAHSPYFGAIAGRHANRIARGCFDIDGARFQLELNENGRHHLHGGSSGFGRRNWSIADRGPAHVELALVSPDGEGGYPGRVEARCRYEVGAGGVFRISLSAETDRPTLANLAAHSYFNLDGTPNILGHRLEIAADGYLPVDEEAIPTGEIRPVAGTPFDFRVMRVIGADGPATNHDHNFCLAGAPVAEPRRIARLEGALSGLAMEIATTEPGLQFYDGYKLDVPVPGLDGRSYGARAGLCLEPQRWPDSPNHAGFAGAVLRPGEHYRQITEYRFSTFRHDEIATP